MLFGPGFPALPFFILKKAVMAVPFVAMAEKAEMAVWGAYAPMHKKDLH